MKFKVGDIVKLNETGKLIYNDFKTVQTGIVKMVFENGLVVVDDRKDNPTNTSWIHEDSLDLVFRQGSIRFTTQEAERYESHGKHKGKTIPVVITQVFNDVTGESGLATCDKTDYNERQGILEAIGNMVCGGNFDREYGKCKAYEKYIHKSLTKCPICGTQYSTIEEMIECEKAHVERKKAKHERYLIRKEAKKRIADAKREGDIERIMKEIYAKEKQNAKTGQVR